ncbi:tRNA dihydrouridine synthase [Oleidesulfovibrio sp.]|uniref:tRNA dihydrouridine synthase n=1 Tax=Oleidesulfovibrio sp. TaxID=2909707 RepID=UPI003A861F8D
MIENTQLQADTIRAGIPAEFSTTVPSDTFSALPAGGDAPWLAPLAGFTDLAFRLLCREFGAKVVCSEMVSAKGLVYRSPGTHSLLETCPQDAPMVLQLFGNETAIMESAMRELVEKGYRWFDLNMGCSVRKVVKTGCGAGMLRDVDNAVEVARVMTSVAGEGKVGFKFRLGWENGLEVYLDLARRLEDAGAGWLTLHPRFARQGFSGVANWDALAQLKQAVRIPVIASGDLFTASDGMNCMKHSGVDGVMFARGALANPAVFEDFTAMMQGAPAPQPDPERIVRIIRRHVVLARALCADKTALFKMRTFVPRYVRQFPGARALRNHLASCLTWEGLDELLDTFFERWRAEGHQLLPEGGCKLAAPDKGGE